MATSNIKSGTIVRRVIALVLILTMCICTIPTATGLKAQAAASWPTVNSSRSVLFIAQKYTPVYTSSNLSTRGTASPYKAYGSACIDAGDECYILSDLNSGSIYVDYPAGSVRKKGWIRRSDVFSVSAPTESFKAKANVTTYRYNLSSSWGNTANGDEIYCVGTASNKYIIYYAPSGSRRYKLAFVSGGDYNKIKGSNGFYAPLKGGLTRSSSCTTNGQYCDYKAASGTPVYAPADGTVQFRQTYAVNYCKLSSYGNNVVFTSDNGGLTVTMAHLSSFNGVGLKYTQSLSYPCSASKYSSKTITLATRHVKQGELIGYSGATGNASGPHLHIEAKQNGTAVNPTSFFKNW